MEATLTAAANVDTKKHLQESCAASKAACGNPVHCVHLNFCPVFSTAARFRSVGGSPQDGFQTAASGICPDAEVSCA